MNGKKNFWRGLKIGFFESAQEKQTEIERLKTKLTSLKSKLQRVNNAFAEGNLDIDEFKELKNPLIPQKVEIEQKIIALQTTPTDRLEPLRNWILEANQASKWVAEENWLEMKSFLKRVGSNRLLRAQTLSVSFKKPWNYLAKTTVALRGATKSLLERNSLMVEARGVEPLS